MKVADLIKQLQQLDPDKRILVSVKEPPLLYSGVSRYHTGDVEKIEDNGSEYTIRTKNEFVLYKRDD